GLPPRRRRHARPHPRSARLHGQRLDTGPTRRWEPAVSTAMQPTITEIVVGDDPDAWRAGGFTVDDNGCRVGTARIALVGRSQGKRILSWSFRDAVAGSLAGGEVDGLPTIADERPPADAAVHPNGVVSIDHIVLATGDSARTTTALEAIGLTARGVRQT